ncbi:MAG TPA: hypothetical protein PKY82_00840 [Pyrinomonadaceae bacterium]|nr:hypothetical protein [Pyrinomonadaceae bacterium]
MLYEFGITPDTFDHPNYRTHRQNEVSIIQLLRGVIENGLIADLHKGRWLEDVFNSRVSSLSPGLKDKIESCLKILNDRHRLVRHPKCPNNPACDADWFNLLLESDNKINFYEVITGDDFFLQNDFSDDRFTVLSEILDSVLWLDRRRTLDLERTETKYREVFTSVLRHAKTLDIVDPYINPVDERWTKTISLLSDLMGKRHSERLVGRIRIHTNEDQISNSDIDTSPDFHIAQWKSFLEELNAKDKHGFEIIYWRVKNRGEQFHDRHIITNQCGISVPNGLDLPNRVNPGTTDISLLDEDVRLKRLSKFTGSTSVYETKDEWRMKLEPKL